MRTKITIEIIVIISITLKQSNMSKAVNKDVYFNHLVFILINFFYLLVLLLWKTVRVFSLLNLQYSTCNFTFALL